MDKVSENGIETNKSFWNFLKPFMTNKGVIASNGRTLIEGNVIPYEYEISKIFNKPYTKIVESSCGNKSNRMGTILSMTQNY